MTLGRNALIGVFASICATVVTGWFFGSNDAIAEMFQMHSFEFIVSLVLIFLVSALVFWAVFEVLWEHRQKRDGERMNNLLTENSKLEAELKDVLARNNELIETHLECRVAASSIDAQDMIDSWEKRSV